MERGRIEFIDEDGSAVPPERREDELDVRPNGSRRGRWPVLVLAAVVVAVCGGVLWHQHTGGPKHPAAAPTTSARTVTVDPQSGVVLDGSVRPTGQLLAEAEQEQRAARLRTQCLSQVQANLLSMSTAYQAALSAGGSVREAERAARAVLADAPDGGISSASYDAMFRVWLINRTALARASGEQLSMDITGLCPA